MTGVEEQKHQQYEKELTKSEEFQIAAEFFGQLGDATRIRIFWLLCHKEVCVSNLAEMMQMSSPAVAHHLRTLKECGLVTARREGKEVFYKISDTQVGRLMHIMVEEMLEITCPEKVISSRTSQEEIVFQVHEYLVEHMEERITIDELAKKFLINKTTLKQVFKKVYGTSMAAHMKEHRMEKAASLLKSCDASIAQIAKAVGYESQSKFSQSFQETYGILPSEYRKME